MGEVTTRDVAVAVHAFDPISYVGITGLVRDVPGIRLVRDQEVPRAEVIVVVAAAIDSEVLAQLRNLARRGTARLVLVVDDLREADLLALVECGLAGVVPRSAATAQRLAASVLAAAEGRGQLPEDLLGALLRQVNRLQREVLAPRGLTASGLDPREVDVLRLLAEGFGTVDIAEKLAYSERTVKNIVHGLLNRLGLRNRPHAVAWAVREGLI
ncbi:regulatory protein, luxR family [Streptoalloteichus tenebrarius]|uniref:Regulatory protein, luxR family n=1 Tax=Streptoalloteichus tenebrarius (strain ATCC 17920 / DSM 40477 / JCM 4838 / CBS 697.72 / NBRC 16177 / NCIMB 11028 / NRRL B-12390 / A12253. 1 / ISP 5477) TaxID=1933 RepID=A0ABT1I183_STRSD|nr:response regulator transcription factor [Streptoalloteichus tenebrarius]MCP2261496.1 regulatory protein, luxR family [Streptoalloteichus tenebrarius]BFE99346.1 response regulator transcription factor [Streptoalloteichus tenebrarius]